MSLMVNVLVNAIKYDGIAIPISAGETAYFTLAFYNEKGENVILDAADTLTFGVKRKYEDSNFIVKKNISTATDFNGTYPFILTSAETNISPGRYYFDVTIKKSAGVLIRPIQEQQLMIKSSVIKIGDVT